MGRFLLVIWGRGNFMVQYWMSGAAEWSAAGSRAFNSSGRRQRRFGPARGPTRRCLATQDGRGTTLVPPPPSPPLDEQDCRGHWRSPARCFRRRGCQSHRDYSATGGGHSGLGPSYPVVRRFIKAWMGEYVDLTAPPSVAISALARLLAFFSFLACFFFVLVLLFLPACCPCFRFFFISPTNGETSFYAWRGAMGGLHKQFDVRWAPVGQTCTRHVM